jgi:hypothetical protein
VNNVHLEALSAGYMITLSEMNFKLNMYYGFIRFKQIKDLSAGEKALIGSSLLSFMEGRLLPFNSDYDYYMEKFNLSAEAASKK